jgi:hypothetical protein
MYDVSIVTIVDDHFVRFKEKDLFELSIHT